jgi:hypothetical protein
MKTNYTNNDRDILLEVCNFYEESYGDFYMGKADSYADFTICFERECGEPIELYLQADFDEDGEVYKLGSGNCQDDYDLLPGFVNEDELIHDMNEVLQEYVKECGLKTFKEAAEEKRRKGK